MSDIQLYLLEVDKNRKEASQIAERTAKRLANKELKLISLIESLGQYINNEDSGIRIKSISYLADVLLATPQKVLSRQHRNLLCDFLVSRVSDDVEVTAPCAKALVALEERGKWEEERAAQVLNILLDHTSPLMQFKSQSDRYAILTLFDMLMAKHREAIHSVQKSSAQFLSRFISYFDGEKDPRNLMIVFSILQVPMVEWDIRPDAQELFNAVFNYFPITFRPPPDDPYGITAQDLKDRLRDCITACADFAPYAFPSLLDKLDSTSMNTKRDVLQTLTGCVSNYGAPTVSLYSVTLWDALKFEVLHMQEEELAEEALKCLAEIAKQLSVSAPKSLAAYLKPIGKECNEHLEDAPTKQSQAAGKILKGVSSASQDASDSLLQVVLPNLFTLYQTSESIAKRRSLLEVFKELLDAHLDVFGEWRRIDSDRLSINGPSTSSPSTALFEHTEAALRLLTDALVSVPIKEVSFRTTVLSALLGLAKVKSLLSNDQLAKIITLLDDIVIKEESYGKDDLKAAAISALAAIAHQKPDLVVQSAFPAFMAELPDTDVPEGPRYVAILEAFAELGNEPEIFDTVILRLKNKLMAVVRGSASSTYIQAILSAMLYAFVAHGNPDRSDQYYRDIAIPLLEIASSPDDSHANRLDDDVTLDLLGRLVNYIVRAQPVKIQSTVSSEVHTLFQQKPLDDVPPFNNEASAIQNRHMILSTHLLAALRRDAQLQCTVSKLLEALTEFSIHADISPKIRAATLQQLSLAVNKFIPVQNLASELQPLLKSPISLLSPGHISTNSIRATFAILKGLVLRNAPNIEEILTFLLSALSHDTHGTTVARGFSALLQPSDMLNKENHSLVSPLHRQRAFVLLIPPIIPLFRSASPPQKPNYLIALSGLLSWLPYAIIDAELASLVPLLLQTLDIKGEEDVKAGTLDTFISILVQNPGALEGHAGSLVTRLLSVAASKTVSGVRSKALRCLSLVSAQLKSESVIPLRRQVVKRLTAALDDPKRVVRTEAVRCRAKWIELDEAGDDEE